MENPSRGRPLVIFDGQCGFCRRSVEGWKATVGDRFEFAPFQEVADQFPRIPREEFGRAIQLIDVDGARYSGAEAVFRILAEVPGKGWLLALYRWLPGFAPAARLVYGWIAGHRNLVASPAWWLWGGHAGPSTYFVSRQLYLRLLGLVYLIAFWSLGVQAKGLFGSTGILPAGAYLARLRSNLGSQAYGSTPTLAWLTSEDWFLTWVLCGGGVLLSVFLVVGILPALTLFLLWAFYLSLVTIGGTFMHFQWDVLLLEAGFISIFYAPLTLRLSSRRAAGPSAIAHFLIVWLLFRLMFQSGLVKLTAGDDCWWDLTALKFHYQTQPLPPWTAWYAHQLPLALHKASVGLTLFVEIGGAVAFFAPRRIRHAACAATIGLMAIIGATGNYNFFNLLTVVLCVALLDDALLRPVTPKALFDRLIPSAPFRPRYLRTACLALLAVFVVAVSAFDGFRRTAQRKRVPDWMLKPPIWVDAAFERIHAFRSINSYGLFRHMTRTRPEIIVEGSDDGHTWKAYEFRWKPGDLSRAPGFVQPHQPRLDWQMWFAALGRYEQNPWIGAFIRRLLEGEPQVLALLADNPFPDRPPRVIRASLYDYQFTTWKERKETGNWWKRRFLRPYSPVLSLPKSSGASRPR